MSIIMALALGPLAHHARRLVRRSPTVDVVVLSPLVALAAGQPAGSPFAWVRLALIIFVIAELSRPRGDPAQSPAPLSLHMVAFIPALAAGLDGGYSAWSVTKATVGLGVAAMYLTIDTNFARWAATVFMLVPVLGRLI